MEFVKIQDKDTLKVIMYFINNTRVSKESFDKWENHFLSIGAKVANSYTTRTKKNNFKHSQELTN